MYGWLQQHRHPDEAHSDCNGRSPLEIVLLTPPSPHEEYRRHPDRRQVIKRHRSCKWQEADRDKPQPQTGDADETAPQMLQHKTRAKRAALQTYV